MSDFSGYEKMPTSLKKLNLSESDYAKLDKCKWVVTEKVHGANFSFVYENRTMKYAKRKEYLSWGDDFFGFQLVVKEIESNIIQLFEELNLNYKGDKFIVYGELFGGKYPHDNVEEIGDVQAVQTGVYYSPKISFCAIDIAIENNGIKSYLIYENAIKYFERHGLFHSKPLSISKLNEALNFDIHINSTVPKQLNLPEISNNLIEGVVIKPYDLKLEDELLSRPIIKLKNKKFEEEKFHQAQKWSFLPEINSQLEELSFIVDELRFYITENRLESAISKIGNLDFKNKVRIEAIENEFLEDTLIDFDEDNNIFNDLSSIQKEWIRKRIIAEIKVLIQNIQTKR